MKTAYVILFAVLATSLGANAATSQPEGQKTLTCNAAKNVRISESDPQADGRNSARLVFGENVNPARQQRQGDANAVRGG